MMPVKRKGKVVKVFRLQVIVEQLIAAALQGDVIERDISERRMTRSPARIHQHGALA